MEGTAYVTWTHLISIGGVAGATLMGILGWMFQRQNAIEKKIDASTHSMTARIDEVSEEKQDKDACSVTHQAAVVAMENMNKIAVANSERLVKIETCLNFLVEALKEHKQAHKDMKLTGGA